MRKGLAPRGRGASPDKRIPWKLKVKILPPNIVAFSENYKHYEACFFLLVREGKVFDSCVVKTSTTLASYLNGWKKYGILPMFLPNPVKVPRGYWEEYKKGAGRHPGSRLLLVKKYRLLKDDAILKLKVLVIDIDSPYEEVLPVWEELRKKLGIEKGYWIVKTKSGNFRAYIFLEPTIYERTYKEVVDGEVQEKTVIYEFWLRPEEKGRNGKTHLENARELLHIIYAFFEKRGLKADRTFPNRINHPVWVEGWDINGKKSEVKEAKEGYAGKLYDLYRRAKKLQKEENLWTFGSVNLTEKFWAEKLKKGTSEKTKGKVVVPKFIVKKQIKELDELTKWKLAVAKLAEKYDSYRFKHVMLPAVGWALWLGIPRAEVESYLREVIPDKKNFDVDIEKAFNAAKPTPFKWEGKELSTEDLVRKFLKKAKGGVVRQSLLREVFRGKNYLLQKIERYLLENGLVYIRAEKLKRGRGRKAYIYCITEKGEAFLEALEEGKKLEEAQKLRKVAGGEDIRSTLSDKEQKKSIYKTLFREQRSGLVGAGKEKTFSYQQSEKVFVSDNITDEAKKKAGDERRKLRLASSDAKELREKKKWERIERLIKARKIYAETWKVFKIVKYHLENQGIEVVKIANKGSGLDGRKLLSLIRYLLTNEVERLNLAGWGRYAQPILEALKEAGLVSSRTKVILPAGAPKLEPKPKKMLEEEFEEQIKADVDFDEIPF